MSQPEIQPFTFEKEKLKYGNRFSECIEADYKELTHMIGYRWVADPIETENNFKPVALINPKGDINKCGSWALSMYESILQAESKIKELKKKKPNITKKVGEYVASVDLHSTDGYKGRTSSSGHFNLLEYCDCQLIHKAKIIKKMDL